VTEEKLLALAEKHYERGIDWLHQAEHADQPGVCAGLASAYFGAGSLALAVRSARLSAAGERELSGAGGSAGHMDASSSQESLPNSEAGVRHNVMFRGRFAGSSASASA
jgi:hypothetical protein